MNNTNENNTNINYLKMVYIYIKLLPENEMDIMQSLFSTFGKAEIISKQFSRKTSGLSNLIQEVILDEIYYVSNLRKIIES